MNAPVKEPRRGKEQLKSAFLETNRRKLHSASKLRGCTNFWCKNNYSTLGPHWSRLGNTIVLLAAKSQDLFEIEPWTTSVCISTNLLCSIETTGRKMQSHNLLLKSAHDNWCSAVQRQWIKYFFFGSDYSSTNAFLSWLRRWWLL